MKSLPPSVQKKLIELYELCEKYPEEIPITALAKFLHVKPDGLRNNIERGISPFGIGWKLGGNRAFKIPTVTFFLWYTNTGGGIRIEELEAAGYISSNSQLQITE